MFDTDAQSARLLKTALALIAGAIIVLLCGLSMGCQSGPCPELATFRAGLHPLDESLYAQHQQLVSDAVALDAAAQGKTITPPEVAAAVAKAKRSATEQQIVAAEVQSAERLYAAGAATQPTN